MAILSDSDYKLNDDLKITFNRTVKHIYSNKKNTYSPIIDDLEDFPPDELITENEEIELSDK